MTGRMIGNGNGNGHVHTADVAVVGLGAAGSALCWQLAQRGVRVVGIDRFHPPHDRGSSHGRTRITRLAVGEGAVYVPLAMRSHQLWRDMEARTGELLYSATGALMIASPAADPGAFHGQVGFFDRTTALARQFGIAHELLDPAEVRRRFPAFLPQDADRAYFEHEGGLVYPERCIRVQLDLARAHGATLRLGETMRSIEAQAAGATVHTDKGTVRAAHVVLCTGAWLPEQLGGSVRPPLRVLRQVLHWFAPAQAAWFAAGACPVFIWLHGPRMQDSMYGFPMMDGVPGVKVATEQMDEECDPDAVPRDIAPALVEDMLRRHLHGRLRGLTETTVDGATCLYTMAHDGGFMIKRHPELSNVTIVSPCSGHGFKHSAALGESLAQQLVGSKPVVDLRPFAGLGG